MHNIVVGTMYVQSDSPKSQIARSVDESSEITCLKALFVKDQLGR